MEISALALEYSLPAVSADLLVLASLNAHKLESAHLWSVGESF